MGQPRTRGETIDKIREFLLWIGPAPRGEGAPIGLPRPDPVTGPAPRGEKTATALVLVPTVMDQPRTRGAHGWVGTLALPGQRTSPGAGRGGPTPAIERIGPRASPKRGETRHWAQ
ncbi:MAG TPA: hypothetical protein VNL71_11100 [Chloroflexota bacterium]|nr:hypothetical protein [Chloroflexota bacterium]